MANRLLTLEPVTCLGGDASMVVKAAFLVFLCVGGLACVTGAFPALAQGSVDAAGWDGFELLKADPVRFSGPFQCSCMAFYFVHYGGPFKVSFKAIPQSDGETGRKSVVRFLDAEERYVAWDYFEFPEKGREPKVWEFAILEADAKPGIYQLRYASTGNMAFDVVTEPDVSLGIMPMRTALGAVFPDQFKNAYLYIPPGSENL